MRILYATHFYPPTPCGGAGHYTAALAEAFRQAGHETRVLCVERWQEGRRHYTGFRDDTHRGVPVRRLHLNWRRAPAPFDYLYDNPVLDGEIQSLFAEFEPEVLHITSCYTLSARIISLAKAFGIPVIVHLVDFWFICPRHTLLRKDGRVCYGGKDAAECQSCMLYGTKADRWTKSILPDAVRAGLFLHLGKIPAVTRLPGLIGLLGDMARRRRYTVQMLCQADAIIAPSQTLLDLYVENGVPRHRIRLLGYGHDVKWAREVRRSVSPQLRVGFLGNVAPIKGVHVLIEAFRRLPGNGRLRLDIHGSEGDQVYAEQLKSNLPDNVFWHGAYRRDHLASILSHLDLLVVPSLWHENHPLVIQEGFAAGCPVIVSDLGGMAEAVKDGVNGLHFRTGDPGHLAQQIGLFLQDPSLLKQMRENIPPVKGMQQEIHELNDLYGQRIADPAHECTPTRSDSLV